MTKAKPHSATDWFDALPAPQKKPLTALRALVLASDSGMVETLKWSQPCYSLNKLVCYLQQAKSHVTLGFQQGAQLADPHGLLEGTGRMMRHLKIPLDSDINEPQVLALLACAIELDRQSD